MKIPIVGASYSRRDPRAGVSRTVNMYPSPVEDTPGAFVLADLPGLTLFGNLGAEIRGALEFEDRAYVVSGNTLYEAGSGGFGTVLGHLRTSSGPVDVLSNRGQVIIVDGSSDGFVYTPETGAFQQILDSDFTGSVRIAVIGGRMVFVTPDGERFGWSSPDDALAEDGLDFDEANTRSDKLVAPIEDHGSLLLFGEKSIEVWRTGVDPAFARDDGIHIETGSAAAFSICKLDNTVYWLGRDEHGTGVVWKLEGYTPIRISDHALEEALQAIADLSGATAYAYQQGGHSFYVLQVPGLGTTRAYDVETKKWCDRAELVDDALTPHRGTVYLYAFGKHLIGAADGRIYFYDPDATTIAGDPLVRDRIFRVFPGAEPRSGIVKELQIDCTIGEGRADGSAPIMLVRYSKQGEYPTGDNWREVPLGVVGQRRMRPPIIRRIGFMPDMSQFVLQVRYTEATPFTITGANAS